MTHRSFRFQTRRLWVVLVLLASACGDAPSIESLRSLHAVGDYEGALEPARALLEESPDDPELNFLYGVSLARTGEPSLSLWSFRKAMQDPEWRVRAAIQIAGNSLARQDTETAIAVTTQALEAEPDNVDALVTRSLARAMSRRSWEGALEDADRALELDPDKGDAEVLRVVSLLGLGRIDEAAEGIDRVEAASREGAPGLENSPGFCVARATFAREKGDLEEAGRRFDECLEHFPTAYTTVLAGVEYFDAAGRLDRSIEILRNALEEVPNHPGYRNSLALHLRSAGEPAEAESVLLEATRHEDPRHQVEAFVALASHHREVEDYVAAAAALRQAIELGEADEQDLAFGLADVLIQAGRYDEALEVAEGMAAPAYRDLVRGRVALERGEPGQALEHLAAGLRLWPDNAVARYYAALAAERIGDFDRAIEEYRYAMRVDSEVTDARLRLARLLVAERQIGPALQAVQKTGGRAEHDVEADLLYTVLQVRLGRIMGLPNPLPPSLEDPRHWGRLAEYVARALRTRYGAETALTFLSQIEPFDWGAPMNASALGLLAELVEEAGEDATKLDTTIRAALERNPDSAEHQAVYAQHLARKNAAAPEVEAAFAKALELDADNAAALLAAARHAEEQSSDVALALWIRASDADPDSPEAAHAAARGLVAAGRVPEAAARLDGFLEQRPSDATAAMERASLLLAEDPKDPRGLELAQRATRFGGGDEAATFLASVHRDRGEPERADEVMREAAEAKARREEAREAAAAKRAAAREAAESEVSEGAPGSSS
jgi:tetratricopeptide (TPR) repeat protein